MPKLTKKEVLELITSTSTIMKIIQEQVKDSIRRRIKKIIYIYKQWNTKQRHNRENQWNQKQVLWEYQ